jgi:3-oxoadipate enol-lactonase
MDVKLFFVQKGEGIPVVLLHGYPFDHTIWEKVSDKLSGHARVISPDLRGHGKSPKPVAAYTIADMALDVKKLLDENNISQALVIGHSMGGYVALSFAQQFPKMLIGLALVASHGYADSDEKKKSRMLTIEKVRKAGAVSALASMPEKLTRYPNIRKICKEYIENADINGMAGVLAAIANRADSMAVLKGLECPVMILAGKDDEIIPIENSRRMASDCDHAVFVELDEAGHLPMLEKPELVAYSIITMINSIKAGKK